MPFPKKNSFSLCGYVFKYHTIFCEELDFIYKSCTSVYFAIHVEIITLLLFFFFSSKYKKEKETNLKKWGNKH